MTALAATLGSLVGASASIATTWITQRTQAVRANTEWRLREREALYKEFITEASRLAIDALGHSLERPDQLVGLYGILSRIRLMSSDQVLDEAEACCLRIVELYRRPNITRIRFTPPSKPMSSTFSKSSAPPAGRNSWQCPLQRNLRVR